MCVCANKQASTSCFILTGSSGLSANKNSGFQGKITSFYLEWSTSDIKEPATSLLPLYVGFLIKVYFFLLMHHVDSRGNAASSQCQLILPQPGSGAADYN